MLLHFAASADIKMCTAEELVNNIAAERWTEDLENDDDESEFAQAMAECPDPKGSDAVEDDSVEVKCMTLREAQARVASAGPSHFLQENGSPLAKSAADIVKEVEKDDGDHATPAGQAALGPTEYQGLGWGQSLSTSVNVWFSQVLYQSPLLKADLVNHPL